MKSKRIYNALSTLFLILALLIIPSVSWTATYYVDATDGNDSNDGFSPATAWKTIAKINSSSFDPGDSILFKCGEIWTECAPTITSGSPDKPIIYASYGSGDMPVWKQPDGANTDNYLILHDINHVRFESIHFNGNGSNQTSGLGMVINLGGDNSGLVFNNCKIGNVRPGGWSSIYMGGIISKNVVFEYCEFYNLGQPTFAHIIADNSGGWTVTHCTFDSGAYTAWGNNAGNVTFTYNTVNVSSSANVKATWMQGDIGNNWTIADNTVNMSASNDSIGMEVTNKPTNIIIERNKVFCNGNGDIGIQVGGPEKVIIRDNEVYGAANIGIMVTANGGLVTRNYIKDCGITGWGAESNKSGILLYSARYYAPPYLDDICENVLIAYNIIHGCYSGIKLLGSDMQHVNNSNKIYNNVVVNTYPNESFGLRGYCSSTIVKNNIFLTSGSYTCRIDLNAFGGNNDINYNCYGDNPKFLWKGAVVSSLAAWQNLTSLDVNSISSDPLFKNSNFEIKSDFKLKPQSPCINAGIDVGLKEDFFRQSILDVPDIGISEFRKISAPENLRTIY